MWKDILLCLLLMSALPSWAQETEYTFMQTRPLNEKFIVDYSDMLSVKLYGSLKSNVIAHVNHETEKEIEYKPNESLNLGFGVGYRWFGLDVAFNFRGVNHDNGQFGKTKRFDFQSSIYTRKFAGDITIQRYKGYYLSNPEEYISNFDPDGPYPIRPDISTRRYGASLLYVFNHDKFSFRSAFIYNERQIKSTGSFLAGPFFSYFRMDADSTLIIPEAESEFDLSQDFRGSEYIRYGLAGGYGYNLVLGHRVFISLSLVIGLGPEIKKTPEINGMAANTESKFTGRAATRIAIGYNAPKFYCGISAAGVYAGERDETEDYLERGVSNAKIFIGKRFDPPEFLVRKK
ncbi:MAG: DUF4421 domain-containing protein [Reichenbachiella sp.]|uniref:DUF4421 domain-containing protein n=1 Tax=Reichenbachiella sp. TaxID=2184521 RepID=UPI00296756DD|nr:DUF4421 domain-containing protein [Reichenbachiella sp.]MDW3209192.1 DUF4421 domain-containing protein [Reichenbachiella sp.]